MKALRWAAPALATLFVGLYLFVAALRVPYPFQLEWIEGSTVDHVQRILAGQKLYVEPSVDFIPQIYTPLYFYVSAALAQLIGAGFLPLRLVSFGAALAAMALIFVIARRESESARAGWVAAGLFAASYYASGSWFELAHSDSLMVALVLGGIAALRGEDSVRNGVVAGVLLALAFFAKQTAAIIGMALVVGTFLDRPRARWWFAGTLAAVAGIGVLALHVAHDGWFFYYAYELPKSHPLRPEMALRFWTVDMGRGAAVALVLAVLGLVGRGCQRRWFWGCALTSVVAVSYIGRLHGGGYVNVLMPTHALLAVLATLAWKQLEQRSVGLAANLVLLQFALFAYDPRGLLPTRSDREAGDAFLARVEALEGPLLVPYEGFVASRVGRPVHTHIQALFDVQRGDPERYEGVAAEFKRRIREGHYGAIVLHKGLWGRVIDERYTEGDAPVDDPDALWTRLANVRSFGSGPLPAPRMRPSVFYVPQ